RWRWNLMDARRAMGGMQDRAAAAKIAKHALVEVLGATDASAEVREKATLMNLQLDIALRQPVDDLAKEYADYVKAYPKWKERGVLAESIMQLAARGEISSEAVARLQDLRSKSNGLLAQILTVKIAELEKLLALKTAPMPLKFVDVEGKKFDLESYRGKI